MNALVERLAGWADRGDFRSVDLGVYRLIFASTMLVLLPNYYWISQFDPAFYRPAPGPFTLLSGFPPPWVLAMLDVVIAAALALLLVGSRTLHCSLLLSGALLVGEGFAYSFGKIDHSILLVLTPLFLGMAGWGNSLSLDARQRGSGELPVNQWAMRAFAVSIGVAFGTAALAKGLGGWLSWSSQATYAYVRQRIERGRLDWLAPFAAEVDLPPLWEMLDWTTVALEGALILCALGWRSWRLGLCAATGFHVGVLLVLNIDFWMNMVAYGAFVLWSHAPATLHRPAPAPAPATHPLVRRLPPATLLAMAFALAAVSLLVAHLHGPSTESLGWVPVAAGLVIAIACLASSISFAVGSARSSSSRRAASRV